MNKYESLQTWQLEDMLIDIAYELHMREYEEEDMMLYINLGIRQAELGLKEN